MYRAWNLEESIESQFFGLYRENLLLICCSLGNREVEVAVVGKNLTSMTLTNHRLTELNCRCRCLCRDANPEYSILELYYRVILRILTLLLVMYVNHLVFLDFIEYLCEIHIVNVFVQESSAVWTENNVNEQEIKCNTRRDSDQTNK